MKILFRFFFREVLKFSLFLSFIFSIVSSEIELLDYLESGGRDIFPVMVVSFVSYFPDIFFLSLPISSFRFFISHRKKFDFLFAFGVSKFKFIPFIFVISLPFFLISVPFFSGVLSSHFKYHLTLLKGRGKHSSLFFEDGKIIFAKKIEGGKWVEYYIFTPEGEFVEKKKVENPYPKIFKENISLSFKDAPVRFLVYSSLISLSYALSGFVGWSFGSAGFFIPITFIFLTVLITSIISF